MNDSAAVPIVVVNLTRQPVEIHRADGVLILPPRGRAELGVSDLGLPQLRVLLANRQLAIQDDAAARPLAGPETAVASDAAIDSEAAAAAPTEDAAAARRPAPASARRPAAANRQGSN